MCVLGGFSCQFCSFGFVNACGIFQLYYETDLLKNHDSSSITWIVTVQIFLMFFLGPVIGTMVDVVGPRPIVASAGAIALLGVCMLSLCTQYWQVMLAQGVCFGIGASGLAMGIVASGSSVGGTIFPIIIPRLIKQHGFPTAVRWIALLIGLLLVVIVSCVSAPFPPKGREKKPTSGLAGYKSLSWVFFLLGCFFVVWGLFAPFDYLPLMATENGMSENLSIYTAAITNAASIIGRVVPGYMSDKYEQLNIMMSVAVLSGLSILCFWLPLDFYPSNAGIIAFGVCYGILSGGFVSLMTPCVVALCNGKVEDLGARLGGFMVVVALAALTGLPIMGAIRDLDSDQSFKGLMIYAGTVMTLGGVFIVAARLRRAGIGMAKI